MLRPIARRPVTTALLAVLLLAGPCAAQLENPVYVDDSPQAWMLFQQARDQVEDNVGEAARLCQELLTDFGLKLIPVSDHDDSQFASVRSRVLDELTAHPALLERYRLIETAAAQRLVDDGQLDLAARTRSLTTPGLEALLRLGQRHLEDGEFHTALAWLDEAAQHPDLDDARAVYLWHMIGMAANYLQDQATFDRAVARLADLPDGSEQVNHLMHLHRDGVSPHALSGITPLDDSPASDLSNLIAEDIWSVPLEHSLLNRRYPVNPDDPAQGRDVREQRRRQGKLNTSAPTVAGETVYINEGHTVRALDRYTGRPVWAHPFSELRGDDPEDTNTDLTMDMNLVSVQDNSLVTLTGHLLSRNRSNGGRVVCLDAVTGSLRWAQDISHIDQADEFEQLFPHGRPVIAEGSVYVMARKARKQQLTAAYVIALDLETGDLRWARHISTSGGTRGTARPFSSLVYDRGAIFVATPLGAVARIEASDGEIRWLKRYAVPLNATTAALHMPWEFDQPVLCDDRVIAIRPDRRRVVALDRETGVELASYAAASSENWGAPRYLLANKHSVYGVGRDIVAFRADQLDQPVWRLSSPQEQSIDDPDAPVAGGLPDIRGRVELSGGRLIVPTLNGVLIVDDETGHVDGTLDVTASGNPVAYDSQILLAGADRLESFMSFDSALAMLRERIASSPTDPDPALSLMKLGIRVRQFPLAMEAANLVIEAINRVPYDADVAQARDELFDRLLEIDHDHIAVSLDDGESLFAMLNSISDSANKRIEYLLAYGDWLGGHAPQQAIERGYQAILSDPKLAQTEHRADGMIRLAAACAADRQEQLIEDHGASIYAAQDDFARLRLDQILSDPDPDPDELASLIEEFPFASGVPQAALAAADIHAKRGEYRQALGLLAEAYRFNPDASDAGRLLGRYAALCELIGWKDEAARTLKAVVAAHPGLTLMGEQGPRPAGDWLSELAPETQPSHLPVIDKPLGDAIFIDGSMVPPYPGARLLSNTVLLSRDDELKLMAPGRDDPLWVAQYEDAPAQLLYADDRDLLLWYALGANDDNPRAVMLDTATGEVRWISADIVEQLGEPIRDLRRDNPAQRRQDADQSFDPYKTHALYDDRALIIVQSTGGVVALSPLDGQTVLWKRSQTIERIRQVMRLDGALVVSGTLHRTDALGATVALAPRIMAFDDETGERIWQIDPVGGDEPTWLSAAPFGTLAYATQGGVQLIDVHSGQALWSNVAGGAKDSQNAWMLRDRVLVNDRDGHLRSLMLADGALSQPFDQSLDPQVDPMDLRDVIPENDAVMALFRNHVLRFGLDGRLRGADAIPPTQDFQWLLRARNLYFVVNADSRQVQPDGQAGRRVEYVYELYLLSENCKVLDQPYEIPTLQRRLHEARLVGPWLYISTRNQTLAIPMTSGG